MNRPAKFIQYCERLLCSDNNIYGTFEFVLRTQYTASQKLFKHIGPDPNVIVVVVIILLVRRLVLQSYRIASPI